MIWFDLMIQLRSPLQTQEWPAPLFFYSCKPTCLAVRSPSPPWKRCSFNFRFSGHIHWIFNIIWENQYQRFYFKCQWWYGWISPPPYQVTALGAAVAAGVTAGVWKLGQKMGDISVFRWSLQIERFWSKFCCCRFWEKYKQVVSYMSPGASFLVCRLFSPRLTFCLSV